MFKRIIKILLDSTNLGLGVYVNHEGGGGGEVTAREEDLEVQKVLAVI